MAWTISARPCSTPGRSMASRRRAAAASRGCHPPLPQRRLFIPAFHDEGPARAANKTLLILPGDGIGPEVMREVRRVIDWMHRRRMVSFDVTEDLVGGAALDARKTQTTEANMP